MAIERITICLPGGEMDELRVRAEAGGATPGGQLRAEWRRGREATTTAVQLAEIDDKLQKQAETLQNFAKNMQKLIEVLQKRS